MRRSAIEIEAERQKKIEQEMAEYKQRRKAEKLKKRKKNVQIAEDVLELILDVADEVFDY